MHRRLTGSASAELEVMTARRKIQVRRIQSAQAAAVAHLRGLARRRQLTLLTATTNVNISEAAVLGGLLNSETLGCPCLR